MSKQLILINENPKVTDLPDFQKGITIQITEEENHHMADFDWPVTRFTILEDGKRIAVVDTNKWRLVRAIEYVKLLIPDDEKKRGRK